jgi:hypothetical protein
LLAAGGVGAGSSSSHPLNKMPAIKLNASSFFIGRFNFYDTKKRLFCPNIWAAVKKVWR